MQQEHKIIEDVLQGVDSYEQLIAKYHIGLIIHCEHLVGDRDDAEDIAQEAFIKAYSQLDKYNHKKARFSTWLYKIATNLALDFLRARKRHIVVDDIEAMAGVTMPAFIEEEEQRELVKHVESLQPPEFREVIESYYWRGQSYQDIADTQHIPINTVRSRLRRAKLQLKEKMS